MAEIWVLHFELESKRQFIEWKHFGFPEKKTTGAEASKEGHVDSFQEKKRPITIDFIEKRYNSKKSMLLPIL